MSVYLHGEQNVRRYSAAARVGNCAAASAEAPSGAAAPFAIRLPAFPFD
jgi:hypothetical protein